jgi:hypothetical protein
LTKSKFDDSLKKKFLITLAWGKTGNQSQQRKIDGRKKPVGPHVKKDEEKPAWTGWESHVSGGRPSNVKSTEETKKNQPGPGGRATFFRVGKTPGNLVCAAGRDSGVGGGSTGARVWKKRHERQQGRSMAGKRFGRSNNADNYLLLFYSKAVTYLESTSFRSLEITWSQMKGYSCVRSHE